MNSKNFTIIFVIVLVAMLCTSTAQEQIDSPFPGELSFFICCEIPQTNIICEQGQKTAYIQ